MPTNLTGFPVTTGQNLVTDSSTQYHALGSYVETNDGRGFRYFLCGATSSVPGKLYTSAAQDTTNLNPSGGLAVAAAAIGTVAVTLTGSLTLAVNLVANGFMSVNVTPGQGYLYRIKGNTAVSSAANCVVTLDDPLIVALTTSSKVVMSQHPYANCVVSATTYVAAPMGVAVYINTNGNYGWLQTKGPASVLNDASTTVGKDCMASTNTAGAVMTATAGYPVVGWTMNAGVTTEYDILYLSIG